MAELITRECICGKKYTVDYITCANWQLDFCSEECMDTYYKQYEEEEER